MALLIDIYFLALFVFIIMVTVGKDVFIYHREIRHHSWAMDGTMTLRNSQVITKISTSLTKGNSFHWRFYKVMCHRVMHICDMTMPYVVLSCPFSLACSYMSATYSMSLVYSSPLLRKSQTLRNCHTIFLYTTTTYSLRS